jgi:hypothetical protein
MGVFTNKLDRVQKYKKVTKNKGKEAKRKAEEQLLTPASIPVYAGDTPKYSSELASRTALIVFKNKMQQDIISELFNIKTSVSNITYITNISLLENIAKMVRDGTAMLVGDTVELVPEDEIEELFVPLTDEQCALCTKKQSKKYAKIVKKQDIAALSKLVSRLEPIAISKERRIL